MSDFICKIYIYIYNKKIIIILLQHDFLTVLHKQANCTDYICSFVTGKYSTKM